MALGRALPGAESAARDAPFLPMPSTQALHRGDRARPRVLLFGEDVAAPAASSRSPRGSSTRFGPDRVLDTPISELAIAGAGFGAAVTGSRPVIEIMFGDFMALAMDSLINQAAKWRYVSNGQTTVPLVVRTTVGAGARFGPIHCQIPATWMQGVPGLKLVCPSNAPTPTALLARRSATTTRSSSWSTSGCTCMEGELDPSRATRDRCARRPRRVAT